MMLRRLMSVTGAIVLAVSITVAAAETLVGSGLGPPTGAVPPNLPLGGFHRVNSVTRGNGKAELLFLGVQIGSASAAERWPVVKALEQFGSLSGLRATSAAACQLGIGDHVDCHTPPYRGWQGYPTFDWGRVRYRSRYVTLVQTDMVDRNAQMRGGVSSQTLALFNRYLRPPGHSTLINEVQRAAADEVSGSRQFPLLIVGNYLQTGVDVAVPGDLSSRTTNVNLPFSVIQWSLQSGKALGQASPTLVFDFNAEANLVTALICHADRLQPSKVCARTAVRNILKHVR